jgi:hypothetical protein
VTAPSDLERRYRRLPVLYPRAFRREHEEEMLSVLLAGAADGQRRPRLAEAANLVANAIFMRLPLLWLEPSAWEFRHARLMAPIRVVIGIWPLSSPGYFAFRVRRAVRTWRVRRLQSGGGGTPCSRWRFIFSGSSGRP